jgi:hypothetical protein
MSILSRIFRSKEERQNEQMEDLLKLFIEKVNQNTRLMTEVSNTHAEQIDFHIKENKEQIDKLCQTIIRNQNTIIRYFNEIVSTQQMTGSYVSEIHRLHYNRNNKTNKYEKTTSKKTAAKKVSAKKAVSKKAVSKKDNSENQSREKES